jgi:hypothetical protein
MPKKYLDLDKYDTYDLWSHTENHLERQRIHYPRRGHLHPSEASVTYMDKDGDRVTEGSCLRKCFYRLKGVTPLPSDSRSELIFAMGRAVESFLIEQWKQMGVWVDNNVEFFTQEFGFPLKGEVDTICAEPPNALLYGVEVKSFYGYMATAEIMGNKKNPGGPKVNQLLQTLVYTHIFRKDLSCFRMVYMARDDPDNHTTFKVEEEQEGEIFYPKVDGKIIREWTVNDVFDRYRLLQEYVDRDELPPRDFEIRYDDAKVEYLHSKGKLSKTKYEEHIKGKKKAGDWECMYCPFKNECYKKANL